MFFDGAVEVIDEPFPDPPAVHCAAALGDDEYTTSLLAAGSPEDDAAAGARRGPSGPACREFLTHVKSTGGSFRAAIPGPPEGRGRRGSRTPEPYGGCPPLPRDGRCASLRHLPCMTKKPITMTASSVRSGAVAMVAIGGTPVSAREAITRRVSATQVTTPSGPRGTKAENGGSRNGSSFRCAARSWRRPAACRHRSRRIGLRSEGSTDPHCGAWTPRRAGSSYGSGTSAVGPAARCSPRCSC